jgi:hypothetical protein
MNRYLVGSMYTRASIKEAFTVTHYISVKQSILLFSLFTDGGTMYLQLDLVQYWQFLLSNINFLFAIPSADSIVYYRGRWYVIHMTFASRKIDVWWIKLIIVWSFCHYLDNKRCLNKIIRTMWFLMLTQLNVIIYWVNANVLWGLKE